MLEVTINNNGSQKLGVWMEMFKKKSSTQNIRNTRLCTLSFNILKCMGIRIMSTPIHAPSIGNMN
jgi:hypothetical protein